MANFRIINTLANTPPQPSVQIVVKPGTETRVCGNPYVSNIEVTTATEVVLPFHIHNNHRGLGGESSISLSNDSVFRDVTSPGILSGDNKHLGSVGLDQHNGGEAFAEHIDGNIVFKPGTTIIAIQSTPPNTTDLVNKDGMRYIEPLDCYECGLNDENLGGTVKVVGSLNVNFDINDHRATAYSYATGCTENGGGDTGLQPA